MHTAHGSQLPKNILYMKKFYREIIKQGKDVKTFAKDVGVSTQTIYSWKSGQSKPTVKNIHKIAKILNMDINIIIDDFHN